MTSRVYQQILAYGAEIMKGMYLMITVALVIAALLAPVRQAEAQEPPGPPPKYLMAVGNVSAAVIAASWRSSGRNVTSMPSRLDSPSDFYGLVLGRRRGPMATSRGRTSMAQQRAPRPTTCAGARRRRGRHGSASAGESTVAV